MIGIQMPVRYWPTLSSVGAYCPSCGSTRGAIDDAPTVALVSGRFDDRDDEALRPLSHSFEDVCPVWARIEGMSQAE